MSILTDEEILECVLGGKVGFEGSIGNRYEFHITIQGADAHRMTAHMIARTKKQKEAKAQAIEDARPKPKTFKGNSFMSEYAHA